MYNGLNRICKGIVLVVLLSISGLALAQPGGGDPGGDPDEVPISGLGALLLAGGALGAKKIYSMRKRDRGES